MLTVENEIAISIGQRIRNINALAQTAAWKDEIMPRLQEMLSLYTEAAIDPCATPDERSVNIQAIHALREIIALPTTLVSHLESQAKSQRKHI